MAVTVYRKPGHGSDNAAVALVRGLYRIFAFDPQQGLTTRDQALGRIHPDDRDKFRQAFNRGIREKVDAEVDYRTVLPDEMIKYAHGIGRPVFNANGELVEIVGTTVDITEHKRAEEALALTSLR